MASSLASFKVGPSTTQAHSKPRKQGSTSATWWSPLFGWSSDPDYIEARPRPRPNLAPGGFTEEKAKKLRIKTAELSTFHDVMYHSAIASRLATHLSDVDNF